MCPWPHGKLSLLQMKECESYTCEENLKTLIGTEIEQSVG